MGGFLNSDNPFHQTGEYIQYCDMMYTLELNKLSVKDLRNKRSVMQNLSYLSPSFDVYFMIDKINEELEARIEQ